jgi:thiol-disulfide isomerase/thioredoxin
MKYLIGLFLVFGFISANAQVKLLSYDELQRRLESGKDTTYVVNFWATWCGPCVEELPHFEKLQKENINKPVKVILMSMDFKSKLKSDVIPFVKKHQLKTEVYVVNASDQQSFIEAVEKKWSGALPATLFLNTQKNVRTFYEKTFTYEELAKSLSGI